ncbi:MAG: CoA pyrophosphatase [Chloroflexi bacterium]|nr:CoA pyrophosphatase [Chloroflexota bacterium]
MATTGVQQLNDLGLEQVRLALAGKTSRPVGDPGLRAAAVLLLVYRKDGHYCVLLNKRTQEVEFNKGDICLPGGARDAEDADLQATALRETFEEMGIRPEDVALLGELDETPTRAGFAIRPYVGTIPYPYQFRPSGPEVAEVLEVPLPSLRDPRNIREELHLLPDGTQSRARAYGHGRHLIYGATARILHQFLQITEPAALLQGSFTP